MITRCEEYDTTIKTGILSKPAKIYDPLGRVVSPRYISWQTCHAANLPQPLMKRWNDSLETFPFPDHFYHIDSQYQRFIVYIDFGDTSSREVCAGVHAVVNQGEEITQDLVCLACRAGWLVCANLTIHYQSDAFFLVVHLIQALLLG